VRASRRYCENVHRTMFKDVMNTFEELVEKYEINASDYNRLRSKIRAWNFRVYNAWVNFIVEKLDREFIKYLNERGEIENGKDRNSS